MAYITKGDLWDLLDDEALTFAGWLLTGSPEASTMKLMLENTAGLTLDTSLIQNQLLPMLVSAGVLTQAVVDKVNAEIEKQNPTYTEVQYDVSEIPRNVEDWIKANRIPSDIPYILNGNTCTITGELPIPARRI